MLHLTLSRGAALAVLASTAVLVLGCAPGDDQLTDPELRASAHRQTGVPVVWMADGSVVPGATSQLVRTPNGVNYSLSTNSLEPGHAYTLWIVIFNHTDGCDWGTPGAMLCGPNDVVNEAARPDMMFAAGHIVGASGKATFSGRRQVGDYSGSANAPVDNVPAYGLEDPYNAEIHLVVHDHGPAIPAFMPDMIKTMDGGCTDTGVPAAGVPSPWNLFSGPGVGAFGRRGPNTCASVQATVHSP